MKLNTMLYTNIIYSLKEITKQIDTLIEDYSTYFNVSEILDTIKDTRENFVYLIDTIEKLEMLEKRYEKAEVGQE